MGASRWCETFLRIFPDTAFLCLHRSLRGVLAEAAAAYPWGLGGSPFWPHSAGHPGNNAETISGLEPPLPAERMSPELLAQVRELHARLDYAP